MAKDKKTIEELEAEVKAYRQASLNTKIDDPSVSSVRDAKNASNELLQLFVGIILIAVGLFMFSKRVIVHSGWYSWRIGGFNMSSGTVTIPLLIGIIWYFFNTKSMGAKLLIILSVIFIVVSIIMSVRINFVTSTMFDYILIFGMMAAGAGMTLRILFKKH